MAHGTEGRLTNRPLCRVKLSLSGPLPADKNLRILTAIEYRIASCSLSFYSSLWLLHIAVKAMASKSTYKTTFEVQRVIQPIYTGGSVALDTTGRILATCLGEDALITDLNNGKQLARIEGVCVSSMEWRYITDAFTRMASSSRP